MINKEKKSDIANPICEFSDDPRLSVAMAASPDEIRSYVAQLCKTVRDLSKIGAALSAEHDLPKLLQMILEQAMLFTNADAGTLYMMNDDQKNLRFEIVKTNSLKISMGGTSANPINWYPVKLYLENGAPNHAMVCAHVALTGQTVNIPDVYDVKGFDFTGTRAFDSKTGYRSKSMLVVPMRNHENEIIGVVQILNAIDHLSGEVIPFSHAAEELIVSLASQAAVSITNTRLIHDLEKLFESFIQVIASAIDEKSPYTAGHIQRVAELTMMIAQEINTIDTGKYADVRFDADNLKELRIASWMHDVGKITTPEYVVDKSTKLETIYDRLNTVQARFEILKRDATIAFLKEKLKAAGIGDFSQIDNELQERIRQIEADYQFVKTANTGGEFMAPEKIAKIRQISENRIAVENSVEPILNDDEVTNLSIQRGTLTEKERQIINNHVVVTIKMLEKLPYPKKLRRIPEIAGAHHEKLDGTGYPNHLTEETLTPQSKIMALADIFEALTAKDRPYKKGKTLSEAMKIMMFMAKDRHIDPELFRIFVEKKIYLAYAQKFMDSSQIDDVNITF
ncbi:MAG: HD domain-containing phosphohydrolase [Candidatus Neomarinimicrobiota bacterium]